MINDATIAAALTISDKRFRVGPWLSNGHFAVRGEKWLALATEIKGQAAEEYASKWATVPRFHVIEATKLRIPRETRERECECECGHEHIAVEVVDIGQAVFEGDGGQTVINPVYADVLSGLTVYRDSGAMSADTAMLLGLDGDEVVAVVMPMREKVRKPKAVRP